MKINEVLNEVNGSDGSDRSNGTNEGGGAARKGSQAEEAGRIANSTLQIANIGNRPEEGETANGKSQMGKIQIANSQSPIANGGEREIADGKSQIGKIQIANRQSPIANAAEGGGREL